MTSPFWKNGIRFECQGTGRCCTSRGEYGYIYLTLEDRRRMAKHLRIRTSQFTQRYCTKTDGYYHLKAPEKDCQFLKGTRCEVYAARPAQCRTWPFWPENMNPRAWKSEVVDFCPGVGKGRLFSADEIKKLMKADPLNEKS